MALPPATINPQYDPLFVKLAREVAIDHHDIETILKHYQITTEHWERISANPHFQKLLEAEIAAWQGATNTHERTKLKAAALVEEWLPEANTRLHDAQENLPAKVELGKLLTRIAGMGLTGMGVDGAPAERFSITINLGADAKLQFEKQVTSKVIDGEIIGET
jgi:hypothetical protein